MAEQWKDKLGRANTLFAEAKAILENEDASGEDRQRVEPLIEDAKRLKAEALQLKEIETAAKELAQTIEHEAKERQEDEAPKAGEYKSMGELLQGIQAFARFGKRDPRLRWYSDVDGKIFDVKDMVENSGSGGGFLVPSEFMAELYAAIAENSIVRQRASVIPMRRRQISIPVLDQTGTTANIPHWFGGMRFYWAEEATEKTESDPSFRKIELVAHKLIGYTRASDELVEDSAISLEALLTGPLGFTGGAQWTEDYTFLRGTGAGQPLGIVNAGATITVARQSVADPITYTDVVNMMEAFLPTGQGVWVANQTAMSNLMTMQDQAGGAANTGTYVWGSAADGVPARLLGMPIIFTEKLPTVGNAGDLLLADFKYYLVGDRKAATVESTQFDRWRYDETSWRMVHRVDGQPWLSAPLTYQDGTTEISPFVILGAKST